jgi:hypothetical protein
VYVCLYVYICLYILYETQSPTRQCVLDLHSKESLIFDEISILMKLIKRHLAARLPVCFDGAVDSNGRVPGKRTLVGRHASQAYLEEEERSFE